MKLPAFVVMIQALVLSGLLNSCTVPLSDLTAIKSTELSFLTTQEDIAEICRRKTVRGTGVAGFELLADAREAFLIRLAAVEAAQRTLDLQYYIWQNDVTGTILADRIFAAADRGVKVRLLLDVTSGAQDEIRTSWLAAHPNIQIGFFNPMEDLQGIFAGNPIPVIGELDRMQCRMHNKILVTDNALVIGGGRNLGDEYFAISKHRNMRDLDYAGAGPVVASASKSFDLYWNSSLTRHAGTSSLPARGHKDLQKLRVSIARKTARLAKQDKCPYPLGMTRAEALRQIQAVAGRMIWAPYEFVADPPERMMRQGRFDSPVWNMVEKAIRESRRGVLMHAAYLIPQEATLQVFREATARGVTLEMLTNSMASIDAAAAMCGIMGRRGGILDSGAALWELKAKAAIREEYIQGPKKTALGMHTKGMVVDGRLSFLGSYNMDPRSRYINTETGVIIQSPAFAARLTAYLRQDLQPENSWRVTRDDDGKGFLWTSPRPGKKPEVHHIEPDVTPHRRLYIWLLQKVISERFL